MEKSSKEFRGGIHSFAAWHYPPAVRTSVADLELPSSPRADQRATKQLSRCDHIFYPLLNSLSLQPCTPSGHAARLPYEAQPGGEVMLLSLQDTRKRQRTSG